MKTALHRTACAAAAMVLVAGCGSASGDGDGGDSSAYESPMAELFGWNEQSSPAEQRAQQLAVEEFVAECMRAEGFEYNPVDWDAQFSGFADEDADLFNDPDAYGEKYGYGVVHNYEQYEEPYMLGEDGEGGIGGPVFEDPNAEYVESLSEREREDYYTVLYGDQSFYEEAAVTFSTIDGASEGDVASSEAFVPPPLEEQGCQGKAQAEVYGEDQFGFDPDVQARLEDFFTQLQDDPEIQDAEQDWLDCMNEKASDDLESNVEGFEVTGPDSMYQLVDFMKLEAMGQEVVDYESDEFGGSGYSNEGEPKPIPDDELEDTASTRTGDLEDRPQVSEGRQARRDQNRDRATPRRRPESRVPRPRRAG